MFKGIWNIFLVHISLCNWRDSWDYEMLKWHKSCHGISTLYSEVKGNTKQTNPSLSSPLVLKHCNVCSLKYDTKIYVLYSKYLFPGSLFLGWFPGSIIPLIVVTWDFTISSFSQRSRLLTRSGWSSEIRLVLNWKVWRVLAESQTEEDLHLF